MRSTKLDMAAKKRKNPERDRIELRAEPEWIDAVLKEAERLGLGISAYVRLAVNERMQRTAAERREPKGGRRS